MEKIGDTQVRFYGQVTDENPASSMIYVDGQAMAYLQPDASGEFSVTVTPWGLGTISVYAADEEWLMSETSQFNFQSNVPVIEGFIAELLSGTTWKISGRVVDEAPGGLTVTFGGALFFSGYYSVVTEADGTFTFCADIPEEQEGIASAMVSDQWGLMAAQAETLIESSV